MHTSLTLEGRRQRHLLQLPLLCPGPGCCEGDITSQPAFSSPRCAQAPFQGAHGLRSRCYCLTWHTSLRAGPHSHSPSLQTLCERGAVAVWLSGGTNDLGSSEDTCVERPYLMPLPGDRHRVLFPAPVSDWGGTGSQLSHVLFHGDSSGSSSLPKVTSHYAVCTTLC